MNEIEKSAKWIVSNWDKVEPEDKTAFVENTLLGMVMRLENDLILGKLSQLLSELEHKTTQEGFETMHQLRAANYEISALMTVIEILKSK